MKTLVILTTILFTQLGAYAQIFAGEWKSTNTSVHDILGSYISQIKLYFKPINDSDYLVYSYCKGRNKKGEDTVVVAKVIFTKINEDQIHLEEVEVLKPKDPIGNCLIKMKLKVVRNKEEIILEGNYSSNQPDCDISGRSIFRKKIKKE